MFAKVGRFVVSLWCVSYERLTPRSLGRGYGYGTYDTQCVLFQGVVVVWQQTKKMKSIASTTPFTAIDEWENINLDLPHFSIHTFFVQVVIKKVGIIDDPCQTCITTTVEAFFGPTLTFYRVSFRWHPIPIP